MPYKPLRATAVAGVMSRAVGDEFVVVHPQTQTAYALRGPSADAWRAIQAGDFAHEATDEALAELQALGLVELAEPGVSRRRILAIGGAATVGLGILAVPLPAAAQTSSKGCIPTTPPKCDPPERCAPGRKTTIHCSGFRPNSSIRISCGGKNYDCRTDSKGSYSCDVTVPSSYSSDSCDFTVWDTDTDCSTHYRCTGSFKVDRSPSCDAPQRCDKDGNPVSGKIGPGCWVKIPFYGFRSDCSYSVKYGTAHSSGSQTPDKSGNGYCLYQVPYSSYQSSGSFILKDGYSGYGSGKYDSCSGQFSVWN